MQQALECAPKLDVKDGIDDRVKKTVDVAEPDKKRKNIRVGATDGQRVEQVVSQADRTDDVEREERNPAEQEHTYSQTTHDICNHIISTWEIQM